MTETPPESPDQQHDAPTEYDWSDSNTPILDLHSELGHDPQANIAISYIGEDGVWNTRHIKLAFADSFARSLAPTSNVYVMVNEVSHLTPGSHGRGDASQVTRLKAVWADLDFKESGLKNAADAKEVISLLSGMLNANPVAIVFSGYGLQPYWEVEEGHINDTNRVYMMSLLKRWGQLVQRVASIVGGHVDSVYDLPRVLRAPGTQNRKIAEHPIDTRLAIRNWSTPVSIELLEETLSSYGFIHADNPVDEFIVVSPPEEWEPAEHDCAWAAAVVDEITQSNPEARHPWLVGKAVKIEAAARNGCVTGETYAELVKLLNDKFEDLIADGSQPRVPTINEVPSTFVWARALVSTMDEARLANAVAYHTHRLGELRAVANLPKESANDATTMRAGGLGGASTLGSHPSPNLVFSSAGGHHHEYTVEGNVATLPQIQEIAYNLESFAYTDTANAARLAARIVGRFLFVPNLGWHVWDSARYIPDETRQIFRAAIESAQMFAAEDTTDAGKKWAQKSLSMALLSSAVKLAETSPEVVSPARTLDAKPYELCTPGGVVNLRTSELRPADPIRDRHTKQTVSTPAPTEIPQFMGFLKIIIGDDERIQFLQELFGLALIGEVLHHVMPLFVGVGANGKSTLLEILMGILGDYVVAMPENFLLEKGHSEHSTEIARLRGVRIALGSETRPDGKFNESRVKMLTGGDTITARLIGKDFYDFKPSHTFFTALNHPPKVTNGGTSFWRRMRKVNFDTVIPEEAQDSTLASRIVAEEGDGVLQWMIEGAQKVIASGTLNTPPSVMMSTQEYREEEDHLQQFIDARTYVSPAAGHSGAEIYANYKGWALAQGEEPLKKTQLLRDLQSKLPLVRNRLKNGQHYTGVGLYEDD